MKLTFLTPRLLMFAAKFPMELVFKYHLYQNIAHSFYGPVKEYRPPPKIQSFFSTERAIAWSSNGTTLLVGIASQKRFSGYE